MVVLQNGRKAIYSSVKTINAQNVVDVVNKVFPIHERNALDIEYLLNYEKGKQPILDRIKDVRPEINEKVVENHAAQIVNFKLAYVFGNPIRYVQKAERETNGKKDVIADDTAVSALNMMCYDAHKDNRDKELIKTFLTCGVGYRASFLGDDEDYSPFTILTLDPTKTFIVYSADVLHKPILAVTYWEDMNEDKTITQRHFTAYTDKYVYSFDNIPFGEVETSINGLGIIPIVEYRCDHERMGCFERALGLLDAINTSTSDRINALAQFVQSFLWFDNIDIDSEGFKDLKEAGAFVTVSKEGAQSKIQLIESSLNQSEVQTLSQYLIDQVYQICSIPSRGASYGSTTGQSTMLSGGWQEAEEDAHRLENMFEEGEKNFLKVIKHCLDRSNSKGAKDLGNHELKLRDIEVKFSRNKISNMLVKTQGLLNMQTFGIHPREAIKVSDLFADPEQVYSDSKEYIDIKWGLSAATAPSLTDNTSVSGSVASFQLNKDRRGQWHADPKGKPASTVKDTQNAQTNYVK